MSNNNFTKDELNIIKSALNSYYKKLSLQANDINKSEEDRKPLKIHQELIASASVKLMEISSIDTPRKYSELEKVLLDSFEPII